MDIIEAIRQRRSVRSFDGRPLTAEQTDELMQTARNTYDPFGGNVSIQIRNFDIKGTFKPGTYGTIKDAATFFLLGIGDGENAALSAGFRFEQVVLKAWQMGLGTCWIAATFKGSDFDRGITWPDGQQLRVICPVGTAVGQTLRERLTRTVMGSKNRKPYGELFFDRDFRHPLNPDSRFGQALEMLRLAPSSTNSQPWRALVDGDTVHFYYLPKSAASVLDCGIGLCHFWETEHYSHHTGTFKKSTSAPTPPANWRYLISYTAT